MQVKYGRPLAYTAIWGAIVAAAIAFVPDMFPDWESDPGPALDAYAATADMPETLLEDGTTIVVGDRNAGTVIRLFEDPRCPIVADFEASGAKAIHSHTLQRKTVTSYTLASFKDRTLGGDGSKRAVNALRAALEVQKFAEYHAVLMEHQAEVEASGGYTTERLLRLADQVPGLRGETFDGAVATMKYTDFVSASQAAYERTGEDPAGPGTPTIVINRTMLGGEDYKALFDEDRAADVLAVVEDRPEALNRRA